MARAGLGWGAQELAANAGVSYPTIHRFESGSDIAAESLSKIELALTTAGAMFSRKSGRVGVTVRE